MAKEMIEQKLDQSFFDLKNAFLKNKAMEYEIRKNAFQDSLTGLPNRILFYDRLKQGVLHAQRTEKALAVLWLKLNGLNKTNNRDSVVYKDDILIEAGKRIINALRKCDTVARPGNNEYLILVQDFNDKTSATTVVNRIQQALRQPFIIGEEEFFITACIGCAIYPVDGADEDSLIANAETALRQAKQEGGNSIVFLNNEIRQEALAELKLTNSLYHALEYDELELYYQPQIDAKNGEIVSLEALLRWNHPEIGLINPGRFIPIAEKTGLILEIGNWVIRTACRQNKSWQERGLIKCPVAVNLSARQFEEAYITEYIGRVLYETGLAAKYLALEVTENISIKKINCVAEILAQLKKLGVGIAIDDFGTAYSSLNYLKQIPADAIKIDKSFIDGIGYNLKDEAIVKTIIALSKNLGFKAVAEGVEKKRQIDFLQKEGCHIIQGYYYHKPMPVREIEKLLYSKKKRVRKTCINSA